jgi:hypothetical protein
LFTFGDNRFINQPSGEGAVMSALEESCQEVVLAWTPSVVFLFIVLLRDWLYRRRRGISRLAKTAHDGA